MFLLFLVMETKFYLEVSIQVTDWKSLRKSGRASFLDGISIWNLRLSFKVLKRQTILFFASFE